MKFPGNFFVSPPGDLTTREVATIRNGDASIQYDMDLSTDEVCEVIEAGAGLDDFVFGACYPR